MSDHARDAAYKQFVGEHRRTLLGASYLMFADAERAEQVVQAALARLYSSWPPRGDALRVALREVLTSTPARLVLPWQRADRVELLDRPLDPGLPSGIVGDLAELEDESRWVLILVRFAGLPVAQAAAVLACQAAQVQAHLVAATAQLIERDPVRESSDRLVEQLRGAAHAAAGDHDRSGVSDLAHGRLLVRRGRLRAGGVAAGLILAVLVGLSQLTPGASGADEPAVQFATSGPTVAFPSPTPSRKPFCGTRQATCRDVVLRDWRTEMASLTRSYVDPGNHYFSGYRAGNGKLYESPELWTTGEGVLGLDLSRLIPGVTEVYLQVATSSRAAVRCGELTHNACLPQRFMDGNTYTLTQTTDLSHGIEVQYSPRGDEVITVVARNSAKGKALDVTRADLMSLVTDPRLRLPPH